MYRILKPDPKWREAYLQIKVPIDIEVVGPIGTITSLIPLNYGLYGLETGGKAGKHFKILINTTKETRLLELISGFEAIKTFSERSGNKFGFTDAILHEENGLLILKFDKKAIQNENIGQIVLKGYVRMNVSELDYSYLPNSIPTETCNQSGCTFIFNISNNLDLPVYQEEKVIVNLNNRNIKNNSNCKFANLISNFPVNDSARKLDSTCSTDSCRIWIQDIEKRRNTFAMELFVSEGIVRLYYIHTKEPIQVKVQVELIC